MENRIYQMIALSQKARKLVAGEFACKQAVLENEALLVIVATDASKNTKKLFNDKAGYRQIPCVEWGTKEKLGNILGKEPRAVIAVVDINFATKISQMIRNRE
ncbi:MAG: ribosomal L7Ae/L30e/S12e/Gadd45 family protein [Candidatus Cellulosilyticum pullistercoris]|uniref:Ribosomal L7Ae/L30e/S12e/Gadd45 family protein n=1 Tax=Candidatus Cellulosilyticum pullistercoris TaxID=2838521 RepID=A0A9E2KB12_9FIRM|nr:ribosomal L7Ae/L30e/S12e/Gadd45 family protein [Candidatus Cellulosilyticum pullistercoris]